VLLIYKYIGQGRDVLNNHFIFFSATARKLYLNIELSHVSVLRTIHTKFLFVVILGMNFIYLRNALNFFKLFQGVRPVLVPGDSRDGPVDRRAVEGVPVPSREHQAVSQSGACRSIIMFISGPIFLPTHTIKLIRPEIASPT
jgi:hypothetical protein